MVPFSTCFLFTPFSIYFFHTLQEHGELAIRSCSFEESFCFAAQILPVSLCDSIGCAAPQSLRYIGIQVPNRFSPGCIRCYELYSGIPTRSKMPFIMTMKASLSIHLEFHLTDFFSCTLRATKSNLKAWWSLCLSAFSLATIHFTEKDSYWRKLR